MATQWLKVNLFVCCLLGCSSGSVPETASPAIDRFFASAAAGDSAAVAQMATNPDPVRRILAVSTQDPEVLAALRSNRQVRSVVVNGDSAFIAF